jgi:hypothetical protein
MLGDLAFLLEQGANSSGEGSTPSASILFYENQKAKEKLLKSPNYGGKPT